MHFGDSSMAQVACLTIHQPKNPNSEPEIIVEEEKFSMVSDDFRVLYILVFQPAFQCRVVVSKLYFSTSLGWDLDSIRFPRPWMKCEICADLREKPFGHRPLHYQQSPLTSSFRFYEVESQVKGCVSKMLEDVVLEFFFLFFFFSDWLFFWIFCSRIPWEHPKGKPHLPSKTCHHRRRRMH